jgi:hypothetical protein
MITIIIIRTMIPLSLIILIVLVKLAELLYFLLLPSFLIEALLLIIAVYSLLVLEL